MTKEEFINLLHSVLEEKKEQDKKSIIKYVEPYDDLYSKCVLGYDMSYTKKTYEENKFSFKTNEKVEAVGHLRSVLQTLVDCYGKEEIVDVLKDM